jgi:hypothetical protein
VAAHTLYEKTNPYLLPGPGGVLSLEKATFEQETDRIVRVRGSAICGEVPDQAGGSQEDRLPHGVHRGARTR